MYLLTHKEYPLMMPQSNHPIYQAMSLTIQLQVGFCLQVVVLSAAVPLVYIH